MFVIIILFFFFFFFFNDTATTEIYTLSLHDALPPSAAGPLAPGWCPKRCRHPESPAKPTYRPLPYRPPTRYLLKTPAEYLHLSLRPSFLRIRASLRLPQG